MKLSLSIFFILLILVSPTVTAYPDIQVAHYYKNNNYINVEFNITNSTTYDTWNFTVFDVIDDSVYGLYNSAGSLIISNVTSNGVVTLLINNITDDTYHIINR